MASSPSRRRRAEQGENRDRREYKLRVLARQKDAESTARVALAYISRRLAVPQLRPPGTRAARQPGLVEKRAPRVYWRSMLARRLTDHDDQPVDDHVVVLRGATWADLQRLLEVKGDRTIPRLAYCEGALEIRSPSRSHEALKSLIGQLLEVYCLVRGIDFNAYGSWTLEDKERERAIEPDECYVFGAGRTADRPDLAIEVIWTSGGLGKLEIYRGLRVREVWIWRRGRITAHALRGDRYEEVAASEVVPGIDLGEIAGLLDREMASQAMREYRAMLEARGLAAR